MAPGEAGLTDKHIRMHDSGQSLTDVASRF